MLAVHLCSMVWYWVVIVVPRSNGNDFGWSFMFQGLVTMGVGCSFMFHSLVTMDVDWSFMSHGLVAMGVDW